MSDKKVRISDELYDQIQKVAEKANKSIKEVVEEAVKAYLLGIEGIEKPLKAIQGKIILTQFDSKCHYCKKEVKKGELCYYTRYIYADGSTRSFIVCLDCYYKDTALAEWYLKKKKLEHIVKGLEKKANELAKEIESLSVQRDLQSLKRECIELWEDFKKFMFESEKMEKIEQMIQRLDNLEEKVRELEDNLMMLSSKGVKRIVAKEHRKSI